MLLAKVLQVNDLLAGGFRQGEQRHGGMFEPFRIDIRHREPFYLELYFSCKVFPFTETKRQDDVFRTL